MKYTILSIVALAVVLAGAGIPASTAQAMNKAELIEAMASKSGLSKADSKKALDGFVEVTTNALKEGDRVSLIGFGSFSISKRSARTGRNPQTGKEIKIASKNTVKFKAGAELSKAVSVNNRDFDTIDNAPEEKERGIQAGQIVSELTKKGDRISSIATTKALKKGDRISSVAKTKALKKGDRLSRARVETDSLLISKCSARPERNPQTGKDTKGAVENTVEFKAGAELSKAVN